MSYLNPNQLDKVLIVDDSATMRAVCDDKLCNAGLACQQAADAEQAWEILEQSEIDNEPFAALLLDWILPKMSGEELLIKIKNDKRFNDLAIMVFTERPDDDVWERVLSRPNTDIQLKDDLQMLPQRMLKFLTTVDEMTVSNVVDKMDKETRERNSNESILLVDDSATVRMRYSNLLRESGYEVLEADGYVEGLKMARKHHPSLAIIDFYMPDGNGDNLCREILAHESADVTVVMFSQRKEVTEVALGAGALDLLFKDDSAHLFLMRINALMHMIRSKRISRQLDLLVWATQAFGFGIMRRTAKGLKAENSTMEMFQTKNGGLENFDQQATFDEPLMVKDLSGAECYFAVQSYPYGDGEEVLVAQDITRMKLAEKVINEAKDAADAANQAKSDFLSNMTHELRSPLNSIIVLSKIMSERNTDNLSEKQLESAQVINKSGNELLMLINDILDLAKVEAGKLAVDVREFNLRDTIDHLMVQLSPLTESKKLNFSCNINDSLPNTIHSDEMRLSQIIRNLISNAVKFTMEGSVTLEVELLDPETIEISVCDTGIGIKAENVDAIFEAFQQEDTSTSRRFGGTGLGLNISRNMIHLLGGEILIESELGKGSRFTINFPLNLAPVKTDIELKSTRLKKMVDSPENLVAEEPTIALINNDDFNNKVQQGFYQPLEKKIVLLVEDDMRNIFTMMAALEPFDVKVITAENGQIALEKLSQKPSPDIVLMDIMMPVMDGYEAIEKIRQLPQGKDIPIIAVTANSQPGEKEKCIALGASDFMNKPVDIEELANKMLSALKLEK